ncbi:MAG: hypothetical protein RL071_2330 [Pseudomonadota bacterium]|jgi:hypothetical protein
MRAPELIAALYLLIGVICAWGLKGAPAAGGLRGAIQLPVVVALWPLYVPALLLRADEAAPAAPGAAAREGEALAQALRAAAGAAPPGMGPAVWRAAEAALALARRADQTAAAATAADPGLLPADPALDALHAARAAEHARLVARAAAEAARWASARGELARLCARLERLGRSGDLGADETDVDDIGALHDDLGRLHAALALLGPGPAAA